MRMRRRGEDYSLDFTERAQVAFQRLSASSQARINAILEEIQRGGLSAHSLRKIKSPYNIYLARASDILIIVFRYEDGVFTILDITNHDQLNRLSRYWSQ